LMTAQAPSSIACTTASGCPGYSVVIPPVYGAWPTNYWFSGPLIFTRAAHITCGGSATPSSGSAGGANLIFAAGVNGVTPEWGAVRSPPYPPTSSGKGSIYMDGCGIMSMGYGVNIPVAHFGDTTITADLWSYGDSITSPPWEAGDGVVVSSGTAVRMSNGGTFTQGSNIVTFSGSMLAAFGSMHVNGPIYSYPGTGTCTPAPCAQNIVLPGTFITAVDSVGSSAACVAANSAGNVPCVTMSSPAASNAINVTTYASTPSGTKIGVGAYVQSCSPCTASAATLTLGSGYSILLDPIVTGSTSEGVIRLPQELGMSVTPTYGSNYAQLTSQVNCAYTGSYPPIVGGLPCPTLMPGDLIWSDLFPLGTVLEAIVTKATVTASISGTTLTVTNITTNSLQTGAADPIVYNGSALTGTGVTTATTITSQVFPLLTGESINGKGRYTINNSQTVSSESMTVTPANYTAVFNNPATGRVQLAAGNFWSANGSSFTGAISSVPTPGVINGFGTITGGSGYVNSTYYGVALTGGAGTGATADIVIAGGAVTHVYLDSGGQNFLVADTLTAAASALGGAGTGFSVPVATIVSLSMPGTSLYVSGLTGQVCVGDGVYGIQPATLVTKLDTGATTGCSTGTTNPYTVNVTQLQGSQAMTSGPGSLAYPSSSGQTATYSGNGKIWIIPSGFDRHNASRLDNSYVAGWGVGIKNFCSEGIDLGYSCSNSLDFHNTLFYNLIGRLTGGDEVSGEVSLANFYSHNYYVDVAEFGYYGQTYLGDLYESAEEGNALNSVLMGCATGVGSVWVGTYMGGVAQPSCQNPAPDTAYGNPAAPTGTAYPLGAMNEGQYPLSNFYAGNQETANGGIWLGLYSRSPANGEVINTSELRGFRQLSSGRSLNTDLAGRSTFTTGGGSGVAATLTYSWLAGGYQLPPICQCSDTTNPAVTCTANETTVNATFVGTPPTGYNPLNDKMKWQCVGQTNYR
jgi:hypothetical protein